MLKMQNGKKVFNQEITTAITNDELAVKKKYYAIPVPIILVRNYQVEK